MTKEREPGFVYNPWSWSRRSHLPQSTVRGGGKILFALWMMNWFGDMVFSDIIGGDAIGTIPTRNGFVVQAHMRGRRGPPHPVSEKLWLFSLFYETSTWITFVALMPWFAYKEVTNNKWRGVKRVLFVGFVIIFFGVITYFFSREAYSSLHAWQALKQR